MGMITKINNRYWLNDRLIYRVSSFYHENYGCKAYKIITSYFQDEDDPNNTDVHILAEDDYDLSNEDITILDQLESRSMKKRKRKFNTNTNLCDFNNCNKNIKKDSAIGRFIDKLTDIANFRFNK